MHHGGGLVCAQLRLDGMFMNPVVLCVDFYSVCPFMIFNLELVQVKIKEASCV